MLTVTATNLISAEAVTEQLNFFSENNDTARNKSRKKEETVDSIRQRFGTDSILAGSLLETDIGIIKPKKHE